MELQRRAVIGKSPKPGWEIWNAPRPIYGTQTWEGEFLSGIFYAAISPGDKYAEIWRRKNIELNSYRLDYYSEADVEAWLPKFAEEMELDIEDIEAAGPEDVRRSFILAHSDGLY